MKAYGVPRHMYWKYPDKQDCLERGAKSQLMNMSSNMRKTSRRVWAKKARNAGKQEYKNEN